MLTPRLGQGCEPWFGTPCDVRGKAVLEQPGLDALARAATVTLQADDGRPWGSGFFVAPRTVLTAAHALRTGTEARDCLFSIRGDLLNGGAPIQARLKQSLLTEVDPEAEYAPIDQDLALVEVLDESVEHECVWLADSASWYGRYVAAYSYHSRGSREPSRPWQARLEVNARDGQHGILFASSPLIPGGSSGGPVVDTGTGGAVGVLKGRIGNRDGGLGIAIALLRRFGPAYQSLMTAHDRWHGTRPLSGSVRNWIDEQQHIASTTLGGDQWTPHDRRTALHLLADLPQPSDPATVVSLARKAAAGWEWAGVTPDLLCWRDGHGLLYEGATPRDAATFLRYLQLVADHVRGGGGSADQIMSWVEDRMQVLEVRGRPRAQATTQGRHPTTANTDESQLGSTGPLTRSEAPPSLLECWATGGAVLVGVSAYEYLPSVPAIHNNLVDLQRLLVSPEIGIPEGNCRVLTDPHDSRKIHAAIDEVVDAVAPASGAFLFYYAGHGRSHPSHGRLLLSLADTREYQTYSYWSFEDLRDQITECGLSTRLVILDSCFSGSALDLLSGPTDSSAAIRGTYVMTSSGATEPSTAPVGARNTDFTGRILEALLSGIPGAGPIVDADALFETVRAHCLADGLPVPARQIRNDGSRIPLMRNRAHQANASK